MKKKILILIMAMVLAGVGYAAEERLEATAGVEPEKHWHQIDAEWLNKFHNPAPGVEMGLDFRFRTIYGRDLVALDDQFNDSAGGYQRNRNYWNFQRYRTRWWANFELSPDVTLNTRLVWEFRTWRDPEFAKDQSTNFDEMLFDRFNITWKNAFDMPLTIVAGRQDIILGRGWLVLDGTPLDGSRTIFFDAIRATYNDADTSTKYDMIYINQDAELDHRIKPFNDNEAPVMEQDERGFILQASNTSIENMMVDGYYIYKEDKDVFSNNAISSAVTRNAEIHTVGARVSGDIDSNWDYYAEAANQWGKMNMATMQAYGFNSKLNYKFNDEFNNSVHGGLEVLSGDDPDSSENEAFDLLWGRWPQWSELYVYSYVIENRIAQVTNLRRLNIGHSFVPRKNWSVSTDYHYLWADENTYETGSRFNSTGRKRGQLLTCWVKYSCCKNLNVHWLAEYFQPGNYYDGGNRDHAVFLRFNVEYTF